MRQKIKLLFSATAGFLILFSLVTPLVTFGQTIPVGAIQIGAAALANKAANVAQAITHPGATLVNYIANAISYLLAQLAVVIFNFAGLFVNVTLDLNTHVTDSQLAHNGWTIVRDIANIGFVLLIIIIAIMTILKIEQYGVKKLLPKLIAAAIIINFSFLIAGVIIDFTNVLTNFFYSRVASNNFGIAASLAGAFNPQTLNAPPAQDNFNLEAQSQSFLEALGTNVLQLIFIIVFTLAGALTLFALAFMLLIRYLELIFLLVISPIVWLFWVFPGLGGQFGRWWHSFLKWTFFAPASAFFLYLALVSVANINQTIGTSTGGGAYGSSGITHLLIQGAQMFVLVGIMLGGILIAQEMGITGASGAIGIAGKFGGSVKDWAGRQGRRYGTAPLRTKLGTDVTNWMQKKSTTPVGRLFNPLKSVFVAPVGTALNRAAAAGERMPEDMGKNWAGMSDRRMAAAFDTMNDPERVYAINRLRKNGTLSMLGSDPQVKEKLLNESYQRKFNSFGQGKEFGDLEKALGANVDMARAIKQGNKDLAKQLAEKFFANFKPEDFSKLQTNEIFKDPDKASTEEKTANLMLREIVTHGITMKNPGGLARVLKDAKGINLKNVTDAMDNVEKDLTNKFSALPTTDPESKNFYDAVLAMDEVRKNTLATRKMGLFSAWSAETGGVAGGPTAAPAASGPKKP